MNNEQFRRLVSRATVGSKGGANEGPKSDAVLLGSRKHSNVPMTPYVLKTMQSISRTTYSLDYRRTVKGSTTVDFARQVAERDAASQEVKKFRSSVPKGSKLAAGYHDRTKDRTDDEQDEKAKRIKALEDTMKLGQIDQETFEKLRDEIVGGDIGSTHLVKGLDRKLLERVRRGEDVSNPNSGSGSNEETTKPSSTDVDNELDDLEGQEVAPITREKVVKKGDMAPPAPMAGSKRNRDAILAELKASRKAAAPLKDHTPVSLGPKFRKIGDKNSQPRIERDEKGREVLITVDEDGNVKRKVRKRKIGDVKDKNTAEFDSIPITNTTPIGMEVPELPQKPVEEEPDDDIFEGVGTNYDPLAGLEDDDEDESGDEGNRLPSNGPNSPPVSAPTAETTTQAEKISTPALQTDDSSKPRNYFSNSAEDVEPKKASDPIQDPTILAALKKVQKMKPGDDGLHSDDSEHGTRPSADRADAEREERLRRRAAMLGTADRDLGDMDMGFGSSKFGDAEEAEESGKVKLSEWKGVGGNNDDDDQGGGEGKGGKKRKRGPKKRKGDKDSAADVMKVLEARKK